MTSTIHYLLPPEYDKGPSRRPRLSQAETFGELRSILNQSTEYNVWENVVRFLLHYRFTAETRETLLSYLPFFLEKASAKYELGSRCFSFSRPAPTSWYEVTPRTFKTHFGFEFADAVSFPHTNSHQRDAIFSSPSLRHIVAMYMGATWDDAPHVHVWNTENLHNLERFASPCLANPRVLDVMLKIPTLQHLYMPFRNLDLQMVMSAILEKLTSNTAARLRSIHLEVNTSYHLNDAVLELALGLPYLEELNLLGCSAGVSRLVLDDVLTLRSHSSYSHLPPLKLSCLVEGVVNKDVLLKRYPCLDPKSFIL